MSIDARDGSWENPYFAFALTAPQGEVLYKRLINGRLTVDEREVMGKIMKRLIEFNNPPEEQRDGERTIRSLGMILSLPKEEEKS